MDCRLDAIRAAPSILAAMHRAMEPPVDGVVRPACSSSLGQLEAAIDDPTDEVTAIAAIHVSANLIDSRAGDRLVDRLGDPRPFVREHAAWALGSGHPPSEIQRAMTGTLGLIAEGGLSGMLAQRTLELLARRSSTPDGWLDAILGMLDGTDDPDVRTRLVEGIGLLDGGGATTALRTVALRPDEPPQARVAAIGALGDRPGPATWETVRRLSRADGPIGEAARLALHDLLGPMRTGWVTGSGARIAQLYLHAELDPDLTSAGMGEAGGIATLLVGLGDALVARPEITSVTTISRGPAERALHGSPRPDGHAFATVPVGDGVPVGIPHAWPMFIDARRGVRRILRSHGPTDRLHLRMADVGSLAGSIAARSEGVPTVFSLAPDPHALIASMERSGTLSRQAFGATDARDHLWFRVALVRRLLDQARDVVLFPRPDLRAQLHDLVGIDIASDPRRYNVVPEGIDTARIEAAAASPSPAWPDVDAILSGLPDDRRELPIAVTVGRMHDIKGMARVVAAWANEPSLTGTTNLVVVGGDLDRPSPDEAAELARIEQVARSLPAAVRQGLVLAGHRPNGTVSRLLVAAHRGYPPYARGGGAYVCGSRKEEFGLAIVEALAAGLPVVVPRIGGPATYVDEGDTGTLVDTGDPVAIAAGLKRALAMGTDEGRARRARDLVHGRFTVAGMARAMASIYTRPTGGSATAAGIADPAALTASVR